MTVGTIDQIRPVPPSSPVQKGAVARDQKGISFAETFNAARSLPQEDILPLEEPETAGTPSKSDPEGDPRPDEADLSEEPSTPAQWPPEDSKVIEQKGLAIGFPSQAPAWFTLQPTAAPDETGGNFAPPEPLQATPDSKVLPTPEKEKVEIVPGKPLFLHPESERGTLEIALPKPLAATPTAVLPAFATGGDRPASSTAADQRSAGRTPTHSAPTTNTALNLSAAALESPAQILPKGQAAPDTGNGQFPGPKNAAPSGPHSQPPTPPLPAAAAIATGPNGQASGPAPGAALLLWGDVTPTQTTEPQDGAALASLSQIGSAPTTGPAAPPLSPAGVPYQAIPAKLAEMRQSGKLGPVELSLAPEELGRIRMQITPDGDTVRIVLQAERSETADLLRRNSDALLSELRQSGFEGASFSFKGWGAGGQSDRPEYPS